MVSVVNAATWNEKGRKKKTTFSISPIEDSMKTTCLAINASITPLLNLDPSLIWTPAWCSLKQKRVIKYFRPFSQIVIFFWASWYCSLTHLLPGENILLDFSARYLWLSLSSLQWMALFHSPSWRLHIAYGCTQTDLISYTSVVQFLKYLSKKTILYS